jgi:hypothetical protein
VEFTAEELSSMKEEAQSCEEAYNKLLLEDDTLNKASESKTENLAKKLEEVKIQSPPKQKVVQEEEKKEPIANDKKSMEKWLDDILDI